MPAFHADRLPSATAFCVILINGVVAAVWKLSLWCRWGVTKEVQEDAEFISKKGNYGVLVPDLCMSLHFCMRSCALHAQKTLCDSSVRDSLAAADKGKVGVNAEEAQHVWHCPGTPLFLRASAAQGL